MKQNKYLMYGAAAVTAAGLAVWAGVPAYFLLLLACPVMMLFMMSSMSGGKGRTDVDTHRGGADSRTTTRAPDGPPDRTDRP